MQGDEILLYRKLINRLIHIRQSLCHIRTEAFPCREHDIVEAEPALGVGDVFDCGVGQSFEQPAEVIGEAAYRAAQEGRRARWSRHPEFGEKLTERGEGAAALARHLSFGLKEKAPAFALEGKEGIGPEEGPASEPRISAAAFEEKGAG